jgi:predicted nucleic acid-binding protein
VISRRCERSSSPCPGSYRAKYWRRAIDVHELLGHRGPLHHRGIPWPDPVIAAAADLADLPLLHYDRDFESIAQLTGQPVEAIAPLGSL